jgi:hypothetical protein
MGHIEEVIEQAEFELEAARSILQNRAWEPLVAKPVSSTFENFHTYFSHFQDPNQWRWPIA